MMIMRTLIALLALAFSSSVATAQEQTVTPLFQTVLPDIGGREGLMVTVDFPPGFGGKKHRHNAHTFVYVLNGTVIMKVEGGEAKILRAGETFYEPPDDVHVVGMNASDTESAKILVFFVKEDGAPISVQVP